MSEKNKPRICMFLLNPYEMDGRVRRTCRFLSAQGYHVTVIAESLSSSDDKLDIDGVRVVRLNDKGLPTKKGRFIKYMVRAALLGMDIEADIYHAFDLDTLAPAVFAAMINRGRVVYESHEYYVGLAPLLKRPLVKAVWILLEKSLIYRVDTVITVSESIAERLSGRYAIEKPEVIYSCSEMKNPSKSNRLRDIFNIPEGKMIAIYAGILCRGRGLELLPEVFARAENAVLVLVGQGELDDRLKKQCERLNLENRVFFIDTTDYDSLDEYYRSADIGIMLIEADAESKRMALPNKFFASLAAGLPVIVSDIPELSSLVKRYGLGLVTSYDIDDVVAAVEMLANDSQYYDRCRKNALDFSGKFTWEKEADKYIRIYDELFKG
jgi:glycosyltransferase involved in cell wall biosynthesis